VKETRETIDAIRETLQRKQSLSITQTDLVPEMSAILIVLDTLVNRIEAVESRRVCRGCPIV